MVKGTKKNIIEVLDNGTIIFIGNKSKRNIEAEITAIGICPTGIRYEATWWEGSKRFDIWLNSDEFTIKGKPKTIHVGFNKGE